MRCTYEDIMLYWSGELSGKRRDEMENHLKTCDQCRQMLSDLEALEQEVKTLPLLKPGKDLVQIALEKYERSEKRFWSLLPVPAFRFVAALVVVFILSVGYLLMNRLDQSPRPQERTGVPETSYVVSNQQIVRVQERVKRLEKRIRGNERKETRFARTTRIHRKVSLLRSELDNLKTGIVESEQFPFRNTFTRQRKKSYEDKTFNQLQPSHDHFLPLSGVRVC